MDNAPAQRLHALDNLRALMMWLGIVLHAGAIYMTRNHPLPWYDHQRSTVADLLVAFIHAFRMPVFFILAGFFVQMLLASRGPAGMARHRVMRLGVPFVVFWPPVFVASVVLAVAFVHLMARGTWGLDMSLMPDRVGADGPPVPRGFRTMHMWFLWMLLWMSLATAGLARFTPASLWAAPARWLRRSAAAWWGPFVLALPLVAAGAAYPHGFLYPSGEFVPPLAEWVHNGSFFVVGLAMYGARDELFALCVKRWRAYTVAGLVAFLASGAAYERNLALPFAFAYALAAWFWSFALIGIALKWMPSRNAVLGYLSESSYWVYLVHLPLTIAFGALLLPADWPALVKLLLNIGATTAVCLATYHALARFTWVGAMLNGKRHARAAVSAAAYASR